jgi:PIN domain nuclease of toxin-antitoxin system
LLDTHVLVRWLTEPRRLSREQESILTRDQTRGVLLGVSATTLVELAVLSSGYVPRLKVRLSRLLGDLEPGGDFCIVPIDLEVAREVAAIGDSLRDPMDRVIVATARVRGLRLVTSDRRIIASKLVPVVE